MKPNSPHWRTASQHKGERIWDSNYVHNQQVKLLPETFILTTNIPNQQTTLSPTGDNKYSIREKMMLESGDWDPKMAQTHLSNLKYAEIESLETMSVDTLGLINQTERKKIIINHNPANQL